LEEISNLFKRISIALPGLGAQKISNSMKLLQDKAIFPIRKKEGQSEPDDLCTLGNHNSWFIADSDHLADRFCGFVPLLAFKVADVQMMGGLVVARDICRS